MFKNIVYSLCCVAWLTCEINAMDVAQNSNCVSGITCNDSKVGYYLLHFKENEMFFGKRLTFEEVVSEWENDLPTTSEAFEKFITCCSISDINHAFFRASTELVFHCLEGKNLDSAFEKLNCFASLLASSNADNSKNLSKSLLFSLENEFLQFMYALDESKENKVAFNIPTLITKLNAFFKILDNNFPFKLIDNEPYQEREYIEPSESYQECERD